MRTLALPTTDHLDPAVRRACWDALVLLDAGWQLRKLRFISSTGASALDVHTPTHRGLTITSTDPSHPYALPHPGEDGTHSPALPFASTPHAVRLANAVAALGQRGGDLLGDLSWALTDHMKTATHSPQSRPTRIPDPVLTRQRRHQPPNFRTAFWLLSTLVCDYKWQISHLGDDLAAGGFLADIPNDVIAVFPASMAADGTEAATLARLIPHLDRFSLDYLRRTHPVTLAHARAQANS